MIIREILITNLKRREDRKYAMLGHLQTPKINADRHRIRFLQSHDGRDYDSSESVVEAAVADGFDQFAEQLPKHDLEKTRWAQHWTWCSALREIATPPNLIAGGREPELPTLLLIDDMRLLINFCHLEFVVEQAMELPGPFHALQLYSYQLPWDSIPQTPSVDGFLQEGVGGRGDYGTVLMVSGAEMLLEAHFSEPYDTPSYQRYF